MQIVTVNLPTVYIDAIARLTERGLYPSRSEAIRVALRDFLSKELEMVEALLDLSGNEKTKRNAPNNVSKKIDMRSIQSGWERNA